MMLNAQLPSQPKRVQGWYQQFISSMKEATLLAVTIETGRTHQIRRHLAGIGHPLAGDKQYAGKLQWDALLQQCPRHLLHARELGFIHPTTTRPVPNTRRSSSARRRGWTSSSTSKLRSTRPIAPRSTAFAGRG